MAQIYYKVTINAKSIKSPRGTYCCDAVKLIKLVERIKK